MNCSGMEKIILIPNSSFDACGWPLQNRTQPPRIRYLDLCSYPVLLLLATAGNIINLLVLKMDKPYGSKGIYLSAIALTDIVYMWSAIVTYVSNYDGEIYGHRQPSVRYFADRLNGLTMFLQETCVIASAWLIVAFTLERFLAIRYPLKHLLISQGRRSTLVVCAVVGLSIIVATDRLVDYYWLYAHFIGLDPRPVLRPLRPKALLYWYRAYLWLLAIIQMGTFLAILVLNILLLRVIMRQHRLRRRDLQVIQKKTDRDWRSGVDKGAVAMLAVCVVLYLVTQMPGFVGNVLYLLDKGCVRQLSATTAAVLAPILNICLNVNFSANFLLYYGANSNFRKGVKSLMTFTRGPTDRQKSFELTKTDSIIIKRSKQSSLSLKKFQTQL